MFIVGIDIAKRSHEAVIINSAGKVVRTAFSFTNNAEGLNKLKSELDSVSNTTSDFIIGMESTSHYWLALYSSLKNLGYIVQVFNPIQSNALRGMYIRKVKNDARDSLIIADVIRFGRYLDGGMPPSAVYELRELCRARGFVVDMVSDIKRKVTALLDQVFPEYETVFSDTFGLTSTEILLKYSTPKEIIAANIRKLTTIIETASRKRYSKAKAEQIKELAKRSFGINLEMNIMGMLIKQHIAHIRYMEKQIAEIEDKIAELFAKFETCITTVPGIGPVLGAVIFSEIGDISKFNKGAKLAAFAGIDPTVTQSGEFTGTHNHMSKRGSPYLRRALWQASTVAVASDPRLKAFFQKKRAEGKSYMTAIGHVTRKLTNIIFAVLRDKKPYYVASES